MQALMSELTSSTKSNPNQAQSVFSVKELVRPAGTFRVDLDKQWCDCGLFQTLHYPCSHVIAACSHVHHDYMNYVSPQYTLQYDFNTWKSSSNSSSSVLARI
ncbi:hypothetical protein QL285_068965 [Trifolium repens]|nr:hypothetical protein QL285_068965 [Trifolium repens]